MRHFRPTCPVAALPSGVGETAPTAALIPSPGGLERLAPGWLRAPRTAVAIAPVAVAADQHLTPTTGTMEQTSGALHRQLLPMRTGLKSPRQRYLCSGRARHGLGVRYRADWPVRAGAAPVSTALTIYPIGLRLSPSGKPPASSVTRDPAGHHRLSPGLTPLAGDVLRYSPSMRGFSPPSTPPAPKTTVLG